MATQQEACDGNTEQDRYALPADFPGLECLPVKCTLQDARNGSTPNTSCMKDSLEDTLEAKTKPRNFLARVQSMSYISILETDGRGIAAGRRALLRVLGSSCPMM
jgi:hypothetical protein